MADDVDIAGEYEEKYRQANIDARRSQPLDPGTPGDCGYCGEHFARLVGGACGRCRDNYKLP